MGQSYRIRTELGINKSINVELNQDYEFLEILSLKIQQADVFTRSCSEYGVVVGRVTANNGFGIPNAKVSIFIPVSDIDLSNPVISAIYPYRNITDVNEDGYRYNLLPYEKSYSKHAATGTFPSRNDALTNSTVIEIIDKYYKFTVKTNESGDYMIMGVPTGYQTIVMDLDLSDMGEFSLTPQDLIRMGRATEGQVNGSTFKTSTDLNSLPQIVSINKTLEVSPLWGEPDICLIAVNRVDFDLRDDANIDIQPNAIFMGSMFSTIDKFRVRKNCRPKENMGNLCDLTSGPGQILALRQTLRQDTSGNPILEQYQLENSGNVIDEDGTWILELPMNLDYIITNEFGDRVVSPDPTVGIPTKGKYRFKVKWQQSKELTLQTRRPYYLVPNVKEYGWTSSGSDPLNQAITSDAYKQQRSSYYFGLDWSGYTEGLSTTDANTKSNQIINCEDVFYEFGFNRVYTVAGLIDQYKKGGRGRFVGIKEIDDDDCNASVNKFPVNEGYRNYDFLYFLFSLLMQIFQFVGLALLLVAHFTVGVIYQIINAIGRLFGRKPKRKGLPIRLPMITYPECEACECKETSTTTTGVDLSASGALSPVSLPEKYVTAYQNIFYNMNYQPVEDVDVISQIHAQATGGNVSSTNPNVYKTLKSEVLREVSDDNNRMFCYSFDLPYGERINIFNSRISYFSGINRIKVTFATDYSNNNSLFHLDNTITVLAQNFYESGTVFTTVDPETSSDLNFNFSSSTNTFGISGTSISGQQTINVKYANPSNQLGELSQTYLLPTGTTYANQAFPMDREYFQVITALTTTDYFRLANPNPGEQTFAEVLDSQTVVRWMTHRSLTGYRERNISPQVVKFRDLYDDFENQYVVILQRGVDPYSPKFNNKYNLGLIFGSTIDDPKYVITATTKLNIPIQKLATSSISVQRFNQNEMFYPSYFFTPGIQFSSFTSTTVGYYSNMDAVTFNNNDANFFGALGIRSSRSNDFYNSNPTAGKYDLSEDLSGNAYIVGDTDPGSTYRDWDYEYYSYNAYPSLLSSPMTLTDKTKNVMRTDRLPSSDQLDGSAWAGNAFVLQQNNNFAFYEIPDLSEGILIPNFSNGFQQTTPDIEGLPGDVNVLTSFNCANMVSLECYTGFSNTFGVDQNCLQRDAVERGCYVLFTNPLFGLVKDIRAFSEWGYRYRFFYAICRGILSQSFTNNWVNGTLFAFPIQVDTTYNNQNKPNAPKFCKDLVYFESNTNNFYFRSSPYNFDQQKFVGKLTNEPTSVNDLNLLFPTTIVNLGFKDSFYSEIMIDPQADAYVLDKLNPTSYSDTSDLVNFFVISRIIDESFLRQMLSFLSRNNSVDQLFTRNENESRSRRVDGDLAQLLSTNSQEGVIKFSPEFYTSTGQTNPVGIYGTPSKPTIGVFYSSTTENLQFKDFISPGRVNYRATPTSTTVPVQYNIKTQTVPFYTWGLVNTTQIFGTEKNNWATSSVDIVQKGYQSLDRISDTDYFKAKGLNNDISMRGYIFNVSGDTAQSYSLDYKVTGPIYSNKFIVGAPYHFYFGTVVGATAIEKFKTKYSVDE